MDDLQEARRLMQLVASEAPTAGPVDATTVISMAKIWAHIALAEATGEVVEQLKRIAEALEKGHTNAR